MKKNNSMRGGMKPPKSKIWTDPWVDHTKFSRQGAFFKMLSKACACVFMLVVPSCPLPRGATTLVESGLVDRRPDRVRRGDAGAAQSIPLATEHGADFLPDYMDEDTALR